MLRPGELKWLAIFSQDEKVQGKYGSENKLVEKLRIRCKFEQTATSGRIVDAQEITENKYVIKFNKPQPVVIEEDFVVEVNNALLSVTGVLGKPTEIHVYCKALK
ncbi:hypothetical protein [Pseudoalteromonas piratica]|uniref:Uncharacterized protein n=1 Tax=Pseudoalteromonas piratica TaxID=1348114 RepID=A0A0A7EEV4_9GAMM|nr:hypothetical protein [Pseudoalteromonas piratica]AIY65195.1 hypothetical protein OM33_08505 [Pseudoalteromonas piratica]